jgi:type I restriction enzyme, S subunit
MRRNKNDARVSALPDGWTRRRLRFDARINPVKSEVTLPEDAEVSFVPMDAVGELGGLRLDQTRELADVYTGYTYFADGDVCVAKITPCFENGKGALAHGLANGVAFGTTELHVLRPSDTLDARLLFYLTIAHDFRSIGESEMLGAGGQKRVPESYLRDWRPPLPHIDVQRRIADFLDEKTAQIDALIDKKRALLERLAEQRQALIAHAVTKGLNPDVSMTTSEIGWIGAIPSHWKVMPVKHVARLESGHTPDKKIDEYWEDCDIPWVSLNDTARLRSDDYIHDTSIRVNSLGIANSSARILPARTVVFTRDATIGEAAITMRPMAVSQHIIAWLCNEALIIPEFLLFCIYGMRQELMSITNGTAIGTIGLGDVNEIQVAVPPIAEQNGIIDYVFDGKLRAESCSLKVSESIEKLIEYRRALVAAAITGQMEMI